MKLRPSCYNGAILKKLVVILRKVELLLLQLGHSKEEECLRDLSAEEVTFINKRIYNTYLAALKKHHSIAQALLKHGTSPQCGMCQYIGRTSDIALLVNGFV